MDRMRPASDPAIPSGLDLDAPRPEGMARAAALEMCARCINAFRTIGRLYGLYEVQRSVRALYDQIIDQLMSEGHADRVATLKREEN